MRSARDGQRREHLPGRETATYLRMLGVDRLVNQTEDPAFDNLIDREFVYPAEGLVVLPDLRPFAQAAVDSVWPFTVVDLGANTVDPAADERPERNNFV